MPRLSDSMEEGTILAWLKQVGDEVAVGDELVEIETDKANMAYEADVGGTLQEILAQEGETLPIGTPIARIGENGSGGIAEGRTARPAGPAAAGDPPSPATAQGMVPPTTSPTGEENDADAESPPVLAAADAERIKASPLARRLARERGLELAEIQGSGPGGRIVKSDGEGAAPPAAGPAGLAPGPSVETAKGETQVRELNKLQQTIARRMAESKATAPHFYLTIEIDMGRAVEAR